jgi:hypothetical protein
MLNKRGLVALAALCLLLAGSATAATTPSTAQAPAPDYHPSLGDLMTMAVQPRHIKVGLAGKARDWAYLTYESGELRNAFNRIARTTPVYRENNLSDLFASGVMPAIDTLDAAIKAKNPAKLDAAYAGVTQACNTCHAALDHAFVVIRAPLASPYTDKDFKPR